MEGRAPSVFNNTKTKLRNALKEAWPHADAASVPFEEAVAI
jgi:hypothetical protein